MEELKLLSQDEIDAIIDELEEEMPKVIIPVVDLEGNIIETREEREIHTVDITVKELLISGFLAYGHRLIFFNVDHPCGSTIARRENGMPIYKKRLKKEYGRYEVKEPLRYKRVVGTRNETDVYEICEVPESTMPAKWAYVEDYLMDENGEFVLDKKRKKIKTKITRIGVASKYRMLKPIFDCKVAYVYVVDKDTIGVMIHYGDKTVQDFENGQI